MSWKHFVDLANALKESRPIMPADSDKGLQWRRDVRAIADVCCNHNNRFNYSRFIEACGMTGEWV